MSSNKTIIKDGRFLVPGSDKPVLSGYMTIENDLITYIGEAKPVIEEDAEVIDGSRLLFMPGLVNTHGHAAMSLLRGYGDDMVLQAWLQEKCGRWKRNSPVKMYTGAPHYPFLRC